MTKLTQEQRDDLADMMDTPAWSAVITLCQMGVEAHQNRVYTSDITKSDREIVLAKARLEGAQEIQRLIFNAREHAGMKKRK